MQTKTQARQPVVRHLARRVRVLVPRPVGELDAAVQDAAPAPFGRGAVLAGGLTPADVSTDAIVTVTRAGSRTVGHLPGALHDAAAATIGRSTYVFGGGNGVSQLDAIVMIDPHTGAAQQMGKLPAPSSDQAAASIGGTAYVVGGYTGTHWLDTIVAWSPHRSAHVVAHLPHPLRYAAVAAADGRVVIAGGSLENGTASNAVYVFRPSSGRLARLGTLPQATTHAAGATLGSTAVVVGGRGASATTPTDRLVLVDPASRTVRVVGRLREPLSDAAAVGVHGRVLVVGGHGTHGTVATLTELVPSSHVDRRTAAVKSTRNVYAADRAGNLSAVARTARPLVYVPNSDSNTVDVVDQRTFKIVRHFGVGALPQHVVPA
jgi:DNA-binding beta-propeller fold protein YncE